MQTQNNTLDFNEQKIFVGIDVHLKSWKVTIMTEKLHHKTYSQDPDPNILHRYLRRTFPGGIYYSVYEAGFCGYWIHNELKSLGINSIVVNPADVPTTDKEKVQKEDKRDSHKLAKALRNGDLMPIHVPSSRTLEDRCLIRMRMTLVKDLTRYKNRIKSFLYFHGIKIPDVFMCTSNHWSNRFMVWLNSIYLPEQSAQSTLKVLIVQAENLRHAVLKITKQIQDLSTTIYQDQVKLLRSIPGIGLLTSMALLTELETINRFKNFDKLCGFIGLIPSTHASGENDKTGEMTPRGNNVLRSVLIESSWFAARLDPSLNKSFHDYCRRMESNKAIIRIARKLLSRIRFVLRNNQPYICSVIN
jgi:transposase